jgi:hypothetical protein
MNDDTVSAVSFSYPGKSTTAAVRAPQPLQKPAYDMHSFMFIMTASNIFKSEHPVKIIGAAAGHIFCKDRD